MPIACPSLPVRRAVPSTRWASASAGPAARPWSVSARPAGPPTRAANRFCGSCGTGLGETSRGRAVGSRSGRWSRCCSPTSPRRPRWRRRLDPEDLRAVLRPFFDAMAEEIDRYGGTVEKYIGDAIVAAFGAPVAHEDDPERAIRCALAMQRRLAGAERRARRARRASNSSLRIGINTGEVIAHSIEEGIVTGEAVNIAARFQSLAGPGSRRRRGANLPATPATRSRSPTWAR